MLEAGHLSLEGSNLSVTGEKARERPPPRIVKIAGIKPGISESVIEMYIENKSNSEFESFDFDDDSGEAVVAFANAQGMSL